jgi:predicted permease
MSWKALRARLRGSRHADALEQDMDEELAFHIDMATRRNIANDMSADEARRHALITFGAQDAVREEAREARRSRALEIFLTDSHFAFRIFHRAPTFALATILTMAIAIAANTTMFSVINAALLRPMPFPDADRVHYLAWDFNVGNRIPSLTAFQYEYVRDNTRALQDVAVYGEASWTRSDDVRIDPVEGLRATPSFVGVTGVRPLLGRVFTAGDAVDGAPAVVLLGEDFWRRELGGTPDIVGRTVTLDAVPRVVIGVLPASFRFPASPDNTDFIAPLAVHADPSDEGHNSAVIARARPDVTAEQVDADMQRLTSGFRAAYPALAGEREGFATMTHREIYVADMRVTLFVLFGAVLCVLLIGCANTANLLLVRAGARRREIAVRASLGAGRRRIVQQLLTEGLVLATCAGALGVLLGVWGLGALMRILPPSPALYDVSIDGRVLAFVVCVTIVTGLVFGFAAALPALRTDLNATLRGSGRGATAASGRVRELLVVGETALAVVLLAGAGLLIASFGRLQSVDPGFDADRVVAVRYGRMSSEFSSSVARAALRSAILERVRAVPGVEAAAIAPNFPMERGMNFPIAPVQNESLGKGAIELRAVSPSYLATLGVALRSGRDIAASDATGERVAIVNRQLAETWWPGENPVGKAIRIGRYGGEWMSPGFVGDVRVIGVSEDIRERGLDQPVRNTVLVPAEQWPDFLDAPRVMVRTSNPEMTVPQIAAALAPLTPNMKPPVVEPLATIVDRTVATPRLRTLILSIFAACALLLAAIGIYGVIASLVQQTTREIGVRMVLGATTTGIAASVMRRCLLMLGVGALIGIACALGATRLLTAMLFEVSPSDVRVFAVVLGVLGLAGGAAGFIPAWRASRVDPGVALRAE